MKIVIRCGLLCIVSLLGCSYGFTISSNVARISDEPYEPHTGHVGIFFEDTKPEEDYIQIALVEIKGGRYDGYSTDTLLEILKEHAQKLGADAVINVKVTPMTRNGGRLLDGEDSKLYATIFMTGIAIKYRVDKGR